MPESVAFAAMASLLAPLLKMDHVFRCGFLLVLKLKKVRAADAPRRELIACRARYVATAPATVADIVDFVERVASEAERGIPQPQHTFFGCVATVVAPSG